MSPLENDLARINGQINRWRAFEFALFGAAALGACCFVLSLFDMWLRPRGAGRLSLSLVFVGAAVAAGVFLARVLNRRRSPAAVAAILERCFPQLDNHLINRVLFSAAPGRPSPWLRAYLSESIPGWSSLPFAELKNRRGRRVGAAALAAALALLAIPVLLYGQAWTVAMRRVVNPFSALTPPTFASVLGVEPGTVSVVQGSSVELAVRAKGRAGQSVTLELTPSDTARTLFRLGSFDASGVEQIFSHTLIQLAATTAYRFHVGDAWPTEIHTLTPVPPLALTALDVVVTPPAYTRLPTATVNALEENPEIPVFSDVTVRLALNRAAAAADLALDDGPPLALSPAAEGLRWSGALPVASGAVLRVTVRDTHDARFAQRIRFSLVADQPPAIRITAPAAKAALHPGALPRIAFEVRDDYGIGAVRLERVVRGAGESDPGDAIASWTPDGGTSLNGEWTGTLDDLAGAPAFRVVAEDCREPGSPNRAASPPIVFEQTLITEQYKNLLTQKEEAGKTLGQLIVWQRGNLADTSRFAADLPVFDRTAWEGLLARQREIRAYAEDLLASRSTALGAARVVVERAREPMADAVSRFAGVLTAAAEARGAAANEAIAIQSLILRLLAFAQSEARGGRIGESSSGLLAILDALIKGQTETRAATEAAALREAPASDAVVERQEALVLDFAEFVELARRDAGMAKEGEPLRDFMNAVAETAESLKIKTDMLRAAQALRNAAPDRALAPQANAIQSLHALKRLLADWRAETADKQAEQALDTLRDARDALGKIERLQAGIVDALRATESQGDKTNGNDDELLEEVVELKASMAEAMLKVATDLQAIPELDAANELVTDCYQIYEAMEQIAGSEKRTDATEIGLQKEDFYLELMAKTGQKMDEMEHWLENTPDSQKLNMEAFDQAEIQSAIPKIGMPEEIQDLIGDLLEEQEELAKKTDDSITNQGDANMAPGWGISEGETVSYNASGKSGNRKPDHKDQDGRSQIGRAGMSDGEIMAKSGRINEGDDTIDTRRTKEASKSGDIEEEGHAEARATGGGKNAGYADEKGMAGTGADPRRQSKVRQADESTHQAELARLADTVYAKAQLSGLKIPPGFNSARENMRRAADAGGAGRIAQMREFQERAVQDLLKARSTLDAGFSDETMGAELGLYRPPEAAVASNPDEAPAEYRGMVSDYFKAIGELK